MPADRPAPSLSRRVGRALAYGMGWQTLRSPTGWVEHTGELTRKDTRRALRTLRRGEAAASVEEARLVLLMAEQRKKAPGGNTSRAGGLLLSVILVSVEIIAALGSLGPGNHFTARTWFFVVGAVFFGFGGLVWLRTADPAVAVAKNRAVFGDEPIELPAGPARLPSRFERVGGTVLAAAFYGVPFGWIVGFDGEHHTLAGRIGSGVFFGVFMVAWQHAYRWLRSRRKDPRPGGPRFVRPS